MEMPKNPRNQTSQKFVIKSKHQGHHLRSQNSDPELPPSSDHEVNLFLDQMIKKSKKFKDLLEQKNIQNIQQFSQSYLLKSVYLKTILKTVLDKMLYERRLGKNLKGLNKANMTEIQNHIWNGVIREIQLYKNELEYIRGRQELQSVLAQRKNEIMKELDKLKAKHQLVKECA